MLKTVLLNLSQRIDRVEERKQWIFDPKTFSLRTPDEQTIKFTATESAVFLELAVAGGLLPLHILIQRFGEIDSSEEHNKVRFEKLISRIRSKIKPYFQEEISIQSVYKQGYQLMLQVTINNE